MDTQLQRTGLAAATPADDPARAREVAPAGAPAGEEVILARAVAPAALLAFAADAAPSPLPSLPEFLDPDARPLPEAAKRKARDEDDAGEGDEEEDETGTA